LLNGLEDMLPGVHEPALQRLRAYEANANTVGGDIAVDREASRIRTKLRIRPDE
jgi:hypothetical protein